MKYTNVPEIIVLREKEGGTCRLVAYNVLTYRGKDNYEFITVEGNNIYFNKYIYTSDSETAQIDFQRRKVNECNIVDRFTDVRDFHNKYDVEEVIMDEDYNNIIVYVSPNVEYFKNIK